MLPRDRAEDRGRAGRSVGKARKEGKVSMKETVLTPMKAIRLKCLDCCCGNVVEVRECACNHCSLYPYRFGRRPEEQKSLSGAWACGDGIL